MNVAIFGAAGSIGRTAAPELIRRGHRVRVAGRDADRLRRAFPECEVVAADIADPAQARAAADGMDAILFAVGVPYPEFAKYPPLMRTAVEAARDAGVGRLLAIGTVYLYGRAQTPRIAETHPHTPHTRKGLAREAQFEVVREAHDPAGLTTALLVLPDFYGPAIENSYLTAVFDGAVTGASATVIGPIDRPHEFVYVPDVVPVIADLLAVPAAFDGGVYHLSGAGTIVPREMFARAYRAAGNKPKLFVAGLAAQRIFGLFNPLVREMVEMNYLWTDPLVLDDAKLARVVGPLHKTSYDDGIRASVDAARAAHAVSAG